MAKKQQGSQNSQDELEKVVEDAMSQPGRTPKEVAILVREMAGMLQSLKFAKIEELAIGSYFVPHEGQLGIEGIIQGSAALMNQYVKAGWQPWQMATPYPGEFAFQTPEGLTTGALNGQWITIIWAKPAEELQ